MNDSGLHIHLDLRKYSKTKVWGPKINASFFFSVIILKCCSVNFFSFVDLNCVQVAVVTVLPRQLIWLKQDPVMVVWIVGIFSYARPDWFPFFFSFLFLSFSFFSYLNFPQQLDCGGAFSHGHQTVPWRCSVLSLWCRLLGFFVVSSEEPQQHGEVLQSRVALYFFPRSSLFLHVDFRFVPTSPFSTLVVFVFLLVNRFIVQSPISL